MIVHREPFSHFLVLRIKYSLSFNAFYLCDSNCDLLKIYSTCYISDFLLSYFLYKVLEIEGIENNNNNNDHIDININEIDILLTQSSVHTLLLTQQSWSNALTVGGNDSQHDVTILSHYVIHNGTEDVVRFRQVRYVSLYLLSNITNTMIINISIFNP